LKAGTQSLKKLNVPKMNLLNAHLLKEEFTSELKSPDHLLSRTPSEMFMSVCLQWKWRFVRNTLQDVSPYSVFNGVQRVEGQMW